MNTPARSQARSTARLAAVQALYQQQMESTALNKLLDEFHQHRLGREIDDEDHEGEVFADAELLKELTAAGMTTADAVVHTAITRMSAVPDTLIARKLGPAVAADAARRAAVVLSCGRPDGNEDEREAYFRAVADFDFWLRSDGRRRNPGATADLIGAALFVALWRDELPRPIL